MDRFKFRIWDKESQKYHNGMEVFDYMRGVLSPDKYVMEQSTGLKDKNGKLIYENDLIKCPNGIYRIAVDDFGLRTAIYNNNPFEDVVEWSDIVKEYALNQENVKLEILGNIHENADLLGEE
mgnify:CR=1 FL=1